MSRVLCTFDGEEIDRFEFDPASGPVASYELEVLQVPLPPGRHYLQLRVRACATPEIEQGVVCGGWSERSDPIYVPEPPALPTFVALLVGLGFLYWWRHRCT